MTSFDTLAEAQADALRQGLASDAANQGFTVIACVCGRQVLFGMSDDERTAAMEPCTRCERTVIGQGGTA